MGERMLDDGSQFYGTNSGSLLISARKWEKIKISDEKKRRLWLLHPLCKYVPVRADDESVSLLGKWKWRIKSILPTEIDVHQWVGMDFRERSGTWTTIILMSSSHRLSVLFRLRCTSHSTTVVVCDRHASARRNPHIKNDRSYVRICACRFDWVTYGQTFDDWTSSSDTVICRIEKWLKFHSCCVVLTEVKIWRYDLTGKDRTASLESDGT